MQHKKTVIGSTYITANDTMLLTILGKEYENV